MSYENQNSDHQKHSEKVEIPPPKKLAVDGNRPPSGAVCVSLDGANTLIDRLDIEELADTLSNTPPEDIQKIIDCIEKQLAAIDVTNKENEYVASELAYKREVLLQIAQENDDKEVVTKNPEKGAYTPKDS